MIYSIKFHECIQSSTGLLFALQWQITYSINIFPPLFSLYQLDSSLKLITIFPHLSQLRSSFLREQSKLYIMTTDGAKVEGRQNISWLNKKSTSKKNNVNRNWKKMQEKRNDGPTLSEKKIQEIVSVESDQRPWETEYCLVVNKILTCAKPCIIVKKTLLW